MTAQLKIHFGGTAEGMAEHRLELGSFGASLAQLVSALRRIASSMIKEATEQSMGRLARGAELRVFLDSISGGSLGLNMEVASPPVEAGYNWNLFDDLPSRAAEQFVRAVDAESKGIPRSAQARKYLQLIPAGVTSQKYEVHADGRLLYETTLGDVKLTEEIEDFPLAIRTTAKIVGVMFEPVPEVRFDASGRKFSCVASPTLIDKAIQFHSEAVLVVATITGSKGRLLWLGPPDSFPTPLIREQRETYVLSTWKETLDELAK
jgi:hypothetical protein